MAKRNPAPDSYAYWSATKTLRKLAQQELIDLATAIGVRHDANPFDSPSEVTIYLKSGPYKVMIEIDSLCKIGCFLAHWTIEPGVDATYSRDFAVSIAGSVNPYHHRKATLEAPTFSDLKRLLQQGFECLATQAPVDSQAETAKPFISQETA